MVESGSLGGPDTSVFFLFEFTLLRNGEENCMQCFVAAVPKLKRRWKQAAKLAMHLLLDWLRIITDEAAEQALEQAMKTK